MIPEVETLRTTPASFDTSVGDAIHEPSPNGELPEWWPGAVAQLDAIVSLPNGWDSHGSPCPDIGVVDSAAGLLKALARTFRPPRPHINPTPARGVQFEWEANERYLEIEVVSDEACSVYFEDARLGTSTESELFFGEDVTRIAALFEHFA